MKIFMLVVIFFLIGGFFIISNNNLALKESGNIDVFISEYADWLGKISENSQGIVGYVVKMEWLPEREN